MDLTTDQVNQIISIVSGLLTIVVGALVRHYLPPRDRRDDDAPEQPVIPPPPANKPKEAPATDE